MACNNEDFEPMCVSQEEKEVIHDLRGLEFGRVSVFVQNGVMINKEITKTIKNSHKNHNNQNVNIYHTPGEYQ